MHLSFRVSAFLRGRTCMVSPILRLKEQEFSVQNRLFRILCVVEFLEQEDLTQRILNSLIGCRRTRCDTHDDCFFVKIQKVIIRHNITLDGPVRNFVIGCDAFGTIDMVCFHARHMWDLQQMRSIGRIKTTNDQDKIQSQLIGILCQFMNRVLSFLKYKTALTNTDCI